MRHHFSRWLLLGLLLIWSLSHATVFGQQNRSSNASKLRQGLNKTITLDFTGQSLVEVLNHFRDKTGLALNLDQTVLMQIGVNPDDNPAPITLKANDEKAGQVLRKFLSSYRLTYIFFEDELLVTSEDMATIRQLRQRVSVDLEEVSAKKALRDLAREHGINLVIDPRVNKQIETPVSLQLENAGIETTVRLLAELANLKAVRMGNVLLVTSEEKARKIREEEVQQMDNPLYPYLSGSIGTIGDGLGVRPLR